MKGLIINLAIVIGAGTALAQSPDRMLPQRPTLSQTQIVFAHAGDLWSVPREGGAASRLTTGPGVETSPVFSPDGSRIAFTAEYDGNLAVFVVPARGGVPKRLTWHPAADTALGLSRRLMPTPSRQRGESRGRWPPGRPTARQSRVEQSRVEPGDGSVSCSPTNLPTAPRTWWPCGSGHRRDRRRGVDRSWQV